MYSSLDRRGFLQTVAASTAVLAANPDLSAADAKPKLKKAVKYGMVQIPGSHLEKLQLVKKLGFQGVEIDSPGTKDLGELVKARDATGIAIHGVIDSTHWKDTLSSPDSAMRARGLDALIGSLKDAKTVGADTVLLVPGVVKDGVTYEQCYSRSQAEVRKALPTAEATGAKIAIEVVWNNFLTTPEQLIEYIDSFKSPHLGAYFDCSNMIKYGVPPAEWIRKLGKRMLKFDFKGFSMKKFEAKQNPWVPIGEGDENWPEILKALAEVGYEGWATAEVKGGGEAELRDVAARMDRVLGL